MSIHSFIKRRSQFDEFVSSVASFSMDHYYRLTALALANIVFTVPLSTFSLWLNISQGVYSWISWEYTHYNFSRMALVPAVEWRQDYLGIVALECTRWFTVLCPFVFFALFGTSLQAKERYRAVISKFTKTSQPSGRQPDPYMPSARAAILR